MSESVVHGWEDFFQEVIHFLESIYRQYGLANTSYSQYAVERLGICIQCVSRVKDRLHPARDGTNLRDDDMDVITRYKEQLEELLSCLRSVRIQWEHYMDALDQRQMSVAYRAPVVDALRRGRPRFDITREQLLYLSSLSFNWTQIAALLCVSRMTIYRRRVEFGLVEDVRQELTDDEVKRHVIEIQREFPSIGETMLTGRFRAMGFHVGREQIRNAVRSIDPLNAALRWPGLLTRRQPYSVPGPNSLWHVDGHHKLIRWRFVTHCGIDGYSRLVVFLHCGTNNRSATVYDLFLGAVHVHGLPSRVRCDQGKENIRIAQHMLEHRGSGRASVITGSSVHNQRIERFWRDLHSSVTYLYYRLFYHMELVDLLDPDSEQHLYALHYVYTARINNALTHFKDGWNNHKIRTERYLSPRQLFTTGTLRLQRSGMVAIDFLDPVTDAYGLEEEGLTGDEDQSLVVVPQGQFSLSEEQFTHLQSLVNPLSESSNYGIELYEETLYIISNFT